KTGSDDKTAGEAKHKKTAKRTGGNVASAKAIGKVIAQRAQEKGVKKVVFDRRGYLYHGRIKALAEAARKAGLEFYEKAITITKRLDAGSFNLKDQVVAINRVTKVVK